MKVVRTTSLTFALFMCGSFSAFAQEDIPKDFTVTLERTMCFGWCPAYSLSITADGTVKFTPEGTFAYRIDGATPSFPLKGRITTGQLAKIFSAVKEVNFFSLQDRYGSSGNHKRSSNCPEILTDSPTAFISVVANGRKNTVSHYLGCRGATILSDLVQFEDSIDKIAGSDQWIQKFGWGTGSVVDLFLSSNELADRSFDRKISVKTIAADPENDVLSYIYTVSGGKIIGKGAEVIWDLATASSGTYTINAAVDDGCGICGKTVTKTVIIR